MKVPRNQLIRRLSQALCLAAAGAAARFVNAIQLARLAELPGEGVARRILDQLPPLPSAPLPTQTRN
jgi:hypothetical protein